MAIEVKELGWFDTVRFFLTVVIPSQFRGSLAPSRIWLPWIVRLNVGKWPVQTINALRQKYKSDLLWVRFIFKRTLLVLDSASMDAVLQSSSNQADPPIKKKHLKKFVPNAALISSGKEWCDRRKFNEQALDSRERVHHHAAAFVDIISEEVDLLAANSSSMELGWSDFRALAQKISNQVLLGATCLEPELATEVDHLVARVNWFFLPIFFIRPSYFSSFYEKIETALNKKIENVPGSSPPTPCLMQEGAKRFADKSANEITQVPRQVGFWVFVLRDALELHVARTLALIAAHPKVQDKVRADQKSNATLTANMVNGLGNLESCIREQLRLWTPVPILLRRATKDFALLGKIPVTINQQLMLYPGYYHRDPSVFGHLAHQFCPDLVSSRLPPIYYFSAGRQECAGMNLALFLIKATLASLLARFRFELIGPQLDTDRLPDIYDHFHVRLRATTECQNDDRSAGGAAAKQVTPACHA